MAEKGKETKGHTVQELAQRFALSEASVRNFVGQLKPVGKRGRSKLYDWREVESVAQSRRKHKPNGQATALDDEKKRLQIKRLEMDLEVQAGKLLPIEDVRKEFLMFAEHVRAHIVRLGRELAPRLEGLSAIKIQKAIDEHNDKLLEKLSERPY